ncbi:type II toxin-antitoxin system HicA family toxin [Snodgrassella alvi]|uniref:type II toxin-antitoxin system HicA family toxin n=1 Tax=Snodgrassella alvi TaxID=1196083 RepID=UPI000C1EA0EE|nr:type II toxin-antitoxin system HicA family toxin [Snodgrassella alvi]PIT34466.1 mRNA interferase [Snodgrassella alvi]PIT36045.1 mRNA interferase [Snodgrassella alvi]WLT05002.1 type II toxin-antitoxin system HicA family toxin [Snodgrassella alvi]
MKINQFLNLLTSQGVKAKDGTKHIKLYYNGKQSTLPRHPSKEIPKRLVEKIKKQLGL